MTTALAAIGLTYDGTDLQRSDLGILLEVVRGLNEVVEVRGTDIIVPGRPGRVARNRVADILVIELRGIVMGGTEAVTSLPLAPGGSVTTLAAEALAAAVEITVTSATGIAQGDYLQVGAGSEAEIHQVSSVAGAVIGIAPARVVGLAAGALVREVAYTIDARTRASYRARMNDLRVLFSPIRAPANLVALLEDGTTATIAARPRSIVVDEDVASQVARISVELESVVPDWTIT